uniref:3-keto-steroid reductase-like n=1 Tax=Saccoglossus kowalevskii TaxID=10224 RepID=A0ABM0M4H6_SACKO
MSEKVVLITGGNAGIGLALAERLLAADQSIHLCLACRNPSKARAAKDALLVSHPGCTIELLQLDVSDLQSVYNAAKEIKKRYSHIEYMYFNAGIMPNPTVNWKQFFKGLFSTRCGAVGIPPACIDEKNLSLNLMVQPQTQCSVVEYLHFDERIPTEAMYDGEWEQQIVENFIADKENHESTDNDDNDSQIIDPHDDRDLTHGDLKELTEMLSRQSSTARVVWTSSSNAKKDAFSLDDVQHHEGFEPYASSKYAVNLLSIALNNVLNEKGIYSHLTNPGLVVSNMTNNIMPNWFWSLITPLLYL